MAETSNTNIASAGCAPGHRAGSKPYVVPVDGTGGCFVVRHGRDYLDGEGNVTRHPVHFHRETCPNIGTVFLNDPGIVGGYTAADVARKLHERAVA